MIKPATLKISSGGSLRFDTQTPSGTLKPYALTRTPLSA